MYCIEYYIIIYIIKKSNRKKGDLCNNVIQKIVVTFIHIKIHLYKLKILCSSTNYIDGRMKKDTLKEIIYYILIPGS